MSGSRMPSLGPRGEGWVALQLGALWLVAVAGRIDGPALVVDPGIGTWLQAAGFVLFGAGGLVLLSGWLYLRQAAAFSVLPRPVGGGELVEVGPFRFVRHPIYAGLIIGGLGIALLRLSVPTLLATLALFVVLDLKRRREEQWLIERFPGYAAYRDRTKAFVPFVY